MEYTVKMSRLLDSALAMSALEADMREEGTGPRPLTADREALVRRVGAIAFTLVTSSLASRGFKVLVDTDPDGDTYRVTLSPEPTGTPEHIEECLHAALVEALAYLANNNVGKTTTARAHRNAMDQILTLVALSVFVGPTEDLRANYC